MILRHRKSSYFEFLFYVLLTFPGLTKSQTLPPKAHINKTHLISSGTITDKHGLAKYVASIQLKTYRASKFGWYHFCGGVILSSKKVLTAAHCLYRKAGTFYMPHEIVVVVGLRNRFNRTITAKVKEVAFVEVHKEFGRDENLYADVGYLILKKDIFFTNSHIAKIDLINKMVKENTKCTVVGWGKLFDKGPTSDEIGFVEVEVLNTKNCKKNYYSWLADGMLCVGDPKNWERDSCTGDSGGPLICDKTLVGLVSWGMGCGQKNLPGVYTDVFYFKDFISNSLGLKAHCILLVLGVVTILFF